MLHKAVTVILAAAGVVSTTGCGYHTVASARAHVPANVHTVAVPVFKNETQTARLEIYFTDAVAEELQRKAGVAVTTTGAGADATLHGTIVTEQVTPLVYNSTNTQASTASYLVILTAKVELSDPAGKVLYRNDHYLFRESYESTEQLATFIQEDTPARKRLAQDFAAAVVSDMLESF